MASRRNITKQKRRWCREGQISRHAAIRSAAASTSYTGASFVPVRLSVDIVIAWIIMIALLCSRMLSAYLNDLREDGK